MVKSPLIIYGFLEFTPVNFTTSVVFIFKLSAYRKILKICSECIHGQRTSLIGLNLGSLYTGGEEDCIWKEKYFNLQSAELTLSCFHMIAGKYLWRRYFCINEFTEWCLNCNNYKIVTPSGEELFNQGNTFLPTVMAWFFFFQITEGLVLGGILHAYDSLKVP